MSGEIRLFELIHAYGDERFKAGERQPNKYSRKFQDIRDYIESHKPAPVELPVEIVALIEHCNITPAPQAGGEYRDILEGWILDAQNLSVKAKYLLPQKHRCIRAGCDGSVNVIEFAEGGVAIQCQSCGLTGRTAFEQSGCDVESDAYAYWYNNDSGVYEGDAQ